MEKKKLSSPGATETKPQNSQVNKLMPLPLRELVRGILTDSPECRDDDMRLLLEVWRHRWSNKRIVPLPEFKKLGIGLVMSFVGSHKGAYLPTPEQIRRTRQRIQEKHEELRGEQYRLRQEKGRQIRETISKPENQ